MLIFVMNNKLALQLVALFLVTQVLALHVGSQLIAQDVKATVVNDNPEDVVNSVGLIAYILGFTGVLLVLIKFLKDKFVYYLMKIIESLAIFGTSLIVFASFVDSIFVVFLSVFLVLARVVFSKNIWLRNFAGMLAVVGAGALIGVSLGVIPVIVFMVLLAVYDYIAVFKTKHMVTLAKSITKKNLAFTYAMPTKEHTFELGTGDLVIPITFSVSLLAAYSRYAFPYNFIPSILIIGAALGGLLATIAFSSRNVGKALPALPPQTVLMVAAYIVIVAVGF